MIVNTYERMLNDHAIMPDKLPATMNVILLYRCKTLKPRGSQTSVESHLHTQAQRKRQNGAKSERVAFGRNRKTAKHCAKKRG
jgi:hypothetical protein